MENRLKPVEKFAAKRLKTRFLKSDFDQPTTCPPWVVLPGPPMFDPTGRQSLTPWGGQSPSRQCPHICFFIYWFPVKDRDTSGVEIRLDFERSIPPNVSPKSGEIKF